MRVAKYTSTEWVAFKLNKPPRRGSRAAPVVMNSERFQSLLRELGHLDAAESSSAELGLVFGVESETSIRFPYAYKTRLGVELNPTSVQLPTSDRRIRVVVKKHGRPTRDDLLSFQNAMLATFPELKNAWRANGVSFAK